MLERLPAGPGPAYTAIMILSIATAVLLKRRGDRSLPLSAVQRWGIALGAFCGAMIGAKLPFVLARLGGPGQRPGLVRQRQDDPVRPGGRLFRRRAGQGDPGREDQDGGQLRGAGGGGGGRGPAGVLRRRLLLRQADEPPLGRRVPRRDPSPPDPALRGGVPRLGRRLPRLDRAPGPVPAPADQALPDRVSGLPVLHRIHPPGADRRPGTDGLPVGRPGVAPRLRLALAPRRQATAQ